MDSVFLDSRKTGDVSLEQADVGQITFKLNPQLISSLHQAFERARSGMWTDEARECVRWGLHLKAFHLQYPRGRIKNGDIVTILCDALKPTTFNSELKPVIAVIPITSAVKAGAAPAFASYQALPPPSMLYFRPLKGGILTETVTFTVLSPNLSPLDLTSCNMIAELCLIDLSATYYR